MISVETRAEEGAVERHRGDERKEPNFEDVIYLLLLCRELIFFA